MYLLHRFSSFASAQSTLATGSRDSKSPAEVALNISTNWFRHPRKGRSNRHPLSVPSNKASATVSLSNTIVSAECASAGGYGSLDLLLPSPSDLPDATQNCLPFPSSEPISLSCPPKYENALGRDFRSCSYADVISHNTDLWPVDVRRKRAKSCLASSYVHRDAHDSPSPHLEQCTSQSGYEPDTEARSSAPARKRRLAHSVRKATVKKAPKGDQKDGRRAGCSRDAHRSRTRSGASNSDAYGGIAEDEDVEMEMEDSNDIAIILEQDKILVERLSGILAEQGFKPAHERLSPPHELMGPVELAPRNPPLRLPSRALLPVSPVLPAATFDHDWLDSQPTPIECIKQITSLSPSQPMAIPFPFTRVMDEDEEMPLASDPSSSSLPLSTVMNFPSPPSAQLEPLAIPSATLPPSSPPTPSPTRPSHKRRHSQDVVILDTPQLVASLIMRYKDRAATRPRSRRTSDGERQERIGRSPLSRTTVVAQAALEL